MGSSVAVFCPFVGCHPATVDDIRQPTTGRVRFPTFTKTGRQFKRLRRTNLDSSVTVSVSSYFQDFALQQPSLQNLGCALWRGNLRAPKINQVLNLHVICRAVQERPERDIV